MKTPAIIMAFFLFAASSFGQDDYKNFTAQTNDFLDEFVSGSNIMYGKITEDKEQLQQLVDQLAGMDFRSLTERERLSFLINAYNLLVIKSVVEHYPIESPMDVPGFFDSEKHEVGNEFYTLNQIENELIREPFRDARIHFVLVCAAVSCPPIAPYAYSAEKLDRQLDERTRKSLNDDRFIRVNEDEEKALISEIFRWYEEDFYWDAESLTGYINKYRDEKIPEDYSIGYYTYDWTLNGVKAGKPPAKSGSGDKSNILEYTPSKLLKKGQFEVQLFNNLYTQTAYRDGNRERVDLGSRQTYYTGLFNMLYGISKNSKINVGFDLNIRSVRIDPDKGSSPLKVFSFEGPPAGRTAVSTIGPKIKVSPLNRVEGFSIQSAFWIPVAADPEGMDSDDPWLDYDMFTWWNQFFYDRLISDKFQIFTEVDLLFRFDKQFEMERTHLLTPVSFFLSFFPEPEFTIYANAQYSPSFMKERLENDEPGNYSLTSDYAQAGLGVKYQITSAVNLELSYSNFFTSMNGGAGNTYNFGIRYIQ